MKDKTGVSPVAGGVDSTTAPLPPALLAADATRVHDVLTVLPTGGGKSLCYQMTPMLDGTLDVVVSPLISLMKDQVDGLRESGYPAAALHSGMDAAARRTVQASLQARETRLLFVSPERLVMEEFRAVLKGLGVRSTRRTASASGGMISGPNIGSWRFCVGIFRTRACRPTPPRPHRVCARTSCNSCSSGTPYYWSAASTDET